MSPTFTSSLRRTDRDMRPSAIPSALVLGASTLVSAAKCGFQTTSSGSTSASTTSASTASASTTSAPGPILDEAVNGNFERYDPNWPGGIYGWNTTGDVQLIQGYGYSGNGSSSSSSACVQLTDGGSSGSPNKKARQGQTLASIEQEMTNLNIETEYTLVFWYQILSCSAANSCKVDAFYGSTLVDSTPYFPQTNPVQGNFWNEFVSSMPVETSSGFLNFVLDCANGAAAQIYVDDMFVSNQVTPNDVNSMTLIYTLDSNPSTSSSSIATQTSGLTGSTIQSSPTSTTASSTSANTTPPSTKGGSPDPSLCVAVTPSPTSKSGYGCGIKVSEYSGYKDINQIDITVDQCAGACLLDENCLSFAWNSQGDICSNSCELLSSHAPNTTGTGVPGNGLQYDRSCIQGIFCPRQPDDTVCIDLAGNNPAPGCTAPFGGRPKSCATPMYSTTLEQACEAVECRDLCMQYPSCLSYSINMDTGECNLYNDVAEDVGEFAQLSPPGPDFYNIDCFTCGELTFSSSYLSIIPDPVPLPPRCPANVSSTATISPTTSSVSSAASVSTTSAQSVTSLTATTATLSLPSTTTSTGTTASTSTATSPSTTSTSIIASTSITTSTSSSQPPTSTVHSSSTTSKSATPTSQCLAPTSTAGSVCNAQGYLANAQYVTENDSEQFYTFTTNIYPNQSTAEICASICRFDNKCLSFAIDYNNLLCRFSSLSSTTGGFVEYPTNTYWYDNTKACVQNIALCAPAPTTGSPVLSTCPLGNGQGCDAVPSAQVPAGALCNAQGYVSDTSYEYTLPIYDYPYQNSTAQCAAVCSQVFGCMASAWDEDQSTCYFLTASVTQAGWYSYGGERRYWSDNACFSCPTCAGPSSGSPPTSTTSVVTTAITTSSTVSSTGSLTITSPPLSSSTASPTTSSALSTSSTTSSVCSTPTPQLSDTSLCGMPGTAGWQALSSEVAGFTEGLAVANLGTCGLQCLQHSTCLSFMYDTSVSECSLYTAATGGMGLSYVPTSTQRFYDAACFSC